MVGFCEVCSGNQCDEQVVSVSNNNNARFLSSLEQNCPLTLCRGKCVPGSFCLLLFASVHSPFSLRF